MLTLMTLTLLSVYCLFYYVVWLKSIMHRKCRNFICGLHILASSKIPESIMHTNVLSNILYGVSQYLFEENMSCLLYGSVVNPYYDIRIGKSFIINNVLYMTIFLPLKHMKAPIMSIYSLHSYYMPTNMTVYKKPRSAFAKLKLAIHISSL